MANTLLLSTINGSLVMAKIAGMESKSTKRDTSTMPIKVAQSQTGAIVRIENLVSEAQLSAKVPAFESI